MARELKFYGHKYKKDDLPGGIKHALVLTTDSWDDYGYQVKFRVSYLDGAGAEHRIGSVKILCAESETSHQIVETTQLPKGTWTSLDARFISLGQDESYYENLKSHLGDDAEEALTALRDIALEPQLAHSFEPSSAYRNALLRENSAHRALRFGRSLALGLPINERFDFRYTCTIEGAEAPIDAAFAFDGSDKVPGRVAAIIGRNAVGKTRFLASLGQDLAQIDRASAQRLEDRDKRFPRGRPLFTRVIAISYSAFDRFRRPSSSPQSSYVYCGIRNVKGAMSRSSLVEAYKQNQERIRDSGRQSDWMMHMQAILGDQSAVPESALEQEISSDSEGPLALLSSGQAILANFVTALLAWIQPNSLILFDEPETHLHPNAVANLFLVLTEILKSFDSYAIVATHSPVVIQEVPSKRVLVFRRDGNVTEAEPLELESFGESVSELTRHVFETIEVDSLYRDTLTRLAKRETFEQVLQRFPLGLGLSAQAYLLARYASDAKKES